MRKLDTEIGEKTKVLVTLTNGKTYILEKNKVTLANGIEINVDEIEIKLCEVGSLLYAKIYNHGRPEAFQPQGVIANIEFA